MPDDLWRIVFAFAGPTPGARQAAARARTLVEFVEYRLAGAGEFGDWNENTIIKRGVVHTRDEARAVLLRVMRVREEGVGRLGRLESAAEGG